MSESEVSLLFGGPGEAPVVQRSRPTMRDVAALAGVAIKTVSRVMNDVQTVDPVLAGRVHDAAEKLGYRPNLAASNLRRSGGRTGTIGLLVEDVANPFSAVLLRSIEDVARTRNVWVLTGSLNEDVEHEQRLARTLIERRADGLIIVPAAGDYRWIVGEQAAGTAFVFVDRVPSPLVADAVYSDSRAGAALAVGHLAVHGHRRIAFLGDDPSIQTARSRLEGYYDGLRDAGLPIDQTLVRTGVGATVQSVAATRELLDTAAPTAIFASQNLVLVGAIRALHDLGLERRVALLGFDDLVLADLIRPAVSVIAQDPVAIGRLAAQRLFARLDGDAGPPSRYEVPTRLLARGSGEIEPGAPARPG